MYGFPSDLTGRGETIGILEFGGRYRRADSEHYFRQVLQTTPPVVTTVSVGTLTNNRRNENSDQDDAEVALDLEVAGAIAPEARFVLYFAQNSDKGLVDAVTSAVHDRTNEPSIISISWGGGPEQSLTPQTRHAINEAFRDAALLGITVVVSAGDYGSAATPQFVHKRNGTRVKKVKNKDYDGKRHVEFPASSPYVLACGGTVLYGDGQNRWTEFVWKDDGNDMASGGGVSELLSQPSWQSSSRVPTLADGRSRRTGRGVPDVSGNAGVPYEIYFDGKYALVGGTSAVAPLWAALVALLNQAAGRHLGFINPSLYSAACTGWFHDITIGTNRIDPKHGQSGTDGYTARAGWDAASGLGSPDLRGLARATIVAAFPHQSGQRPRALGAVRSGERKRTSNGRNRNARSNGLRRSSTRADRATQP
jgi:kumamolisin